MTNDEVNQAVARKLGHFVRCGMAEACDLPNGIIPDYCTSISAAWEIVEYLVAKHYNVKVIAMNSLGTCVINKNGGEPLASNNSDAAPMAICMAFLKLTD